MGPRSVVHLDQPQGLRSVQCLPPLLALTLAFIIEEMGARYTYPDHKHVDDVLAFRTRPVVCPEIQRHLCPGLFEEVVPGAADRNIFAWENAHGCSMPPPPRPATRSPGKSADTPGTRPGRSCAGTGSHHARLIRTVSPGAKTSIA
jgi:hypothetical protein